MRSDFYTNEYLDFLNKLKDEIDQRSDQPFDKLSSFISEKTFDSSVRTDLLFAIGLMKAPEEILIEIQTRKRMVYLSLGVHSKSYHREFIRAEIPGKGRINDQAAREALLSIKPGGYYCSLNIPQIIREAEELILTCKIERW